MKYSSSDFLRSGRVGTSSRQRTAALAKMSTMQYHRQEQVNCGFCSSIELRGSGKKKFCIGGLRHTVVGRYCVVRLGKMELVLILAPKVKGREFALKFDLN